MKKLLISYTNYNYWANEKLANVMLGLNESLFLETLPSSFPTLFSTVEHILQAEQVWLQRILNNAPTKKPEFEQKDRNALLNALLKASFDWHFFLKETSEEKLDEIISYNNWQGVPFSTPMWQIIQHVFNHSTFHRGQLITMLRQMGITSLPSTDYITYTREINN